MRLEKVAFAVVMSVCSAAVAEDNVLVDLSVLDNLNSSYIVPSEPLFPVLPKKNPPVVKKVAKKTPKAKKLKAVVKKETVKPVVETETKVEVVDVEPVVVVDVEPAPVAPLQNQVVDKALETSQKIIDDKKDETITAASQQESKVIKNIEVPAISEQDNAPIIPQSEVVTASETPSESISNAAKELPPLLVEEPTVESDNIVNTIVFADGVDELTPEQMSQIDAIICSFQNTDTKKIAIYSYNLDDGVDSFKKKRISLNRAVEIRSYLIKKGYKNFSIKVININSGSDKVNTVQLEEI